MKFALTTFVILLVFSIYHNNNASPTSIRTFEEFKVSLLHSHFFTPLIDHFLGSDNSINNTKVLNMRKLHEKNFQETLRYVQANQDKAVINEYADLVCIFHNYNDND